MRYELDTLVVIAILAYVINSSIIKVSSYMEI